MRLTVFVVLLSSSVFAQTAGQMQAAQEKVQHNVQSEQESWKAAQALNSSMNSRVTPAATPAPRFSPKPGTFQDSVPPVAITDDTPGAVIYFTTDGSTPTPKSQRYAGPISLSATTTLKAIAIASSYGQSRSRTARGKYVVK